MRRALRALGVLIAVAVVAWSCAEAAPGTAGERAARAAGLLAADDSEVAARDRAAIVAAVEREHGLDRGLAVRVAGYLGGLATLDFGRSWRDGAPVRARLGRALGPTLVLVLAALALAVALGLGAALLAVDRGGAVDRGLSAAAALALAVPPAWLGVIALRTFATGAPWSVLPTGGLDTLAAGVLPIATLAVVPACFLARFARAELSRALREPWALAVLARGASRRRLVYVHALRASLAGLAAVGVNLVAYSLGASLVVERVFGIRGLGSLVLDASARGDAPVVVGATLVAGALVALASLLADVAVSALDPRAAAAAGRGRGVDA